MRVELAYGSGRLAVELPDERTTVVAPNFIPRAADEAAAADPELLLGAGKAELGEEHARERVVVMLAGVHEDLLVALAQQARHGGRLDELRPVAYDGEDPHGGEEGRPGRVMCFACAVSPW